MLQEFKSLAEEKRESAELWKANTLTLMSIALHACDISAQAKKQALALQWSAALSFRATLSCRATLSFRAKLSSGGSKKKCETLISDENREF